MRPGPPAHILADGPGWAPRVSAWLGTSLLAESVPVNSGDFEETDSAIPEQITLNVPVRDRAGRSWDPGEDPRHPLARFGQRLFVDVETRSRRGQSWETPFGWFQIQDWDTSEDESEIVVTATGLLQVPADDKLARPEQPAPGATFESEIRRLMTGGIPVVIHPDLVDRSVPGSFQWDEDRLDALYDLADAWPARIATDGDGIVWFRPPLGDVPDPVVTLTDGEGGVLISAPRSDSRASVYNAVTATSTTDDPDSVPVSGTWVTPSGIYAPETYGIVRRRYASPLLTSEDACLAAARTIAQDSQRQGRVQDVQLPPDPRLQRGDAVSLKWNGTTRTGWIVEARMPLTVSNSPMSLVIGLPS